ncbi:initiator tRNA phosphoribosyl transferase [Xylariaceae sp. FL0662B]|nr:initiator tRNA phosphoribosyl transferase [Xylariaceae sp. FL0662B]
MATSSSTTATATATSELIFPAQANHNFSRILTDLKRSNLSLTNRLRSVREDADFVCAVGAAYGRPLIANERCGSWYVPPGRKAGSSYFKSTDGHAGQWAFSTRRLNLHLIPVIGAHDGVIVVDSTRRGKAMPDALAKTLPIWCCVLNRVLFPDFDCHYHALHTPPAAVSPSEHAQIAARIPSHVAALRALDLGAPALAALRRHLRKPLRPLWVTPESRLPPPAVAGGEIFADFHPVVCCTSSRRVRGAAEMSEAGYIQGAGDDVENWALGLTPVVFWRHVDALTATPEAELPGLVRALVAAASSEEEEEAADTVDAPAPPPRRVGACLFVGCLPLAAEPPSPFACTIAIRSKTTDPDTWVAGPLSMEVGLGKHKVASRNLRLALPRISDFARRFLERTRDRDRDRDPSSQGLDAGSSGQQRRILIACETGKDLSVGVALALSCQYFDNDGNCRLDQPNSGHTKSDIRVKLGRIMTMFPEANPSRTTLQSVNSFLMG